MQRQEVAVKREPGCCRTRSAADRGHSPVNSADRRETAALGRGTPQGAFNTTNAVLAALSVTASVLILFAGKAGAGRTAVTD
ncbi:hypothetical protein GCM10023335_52360 [Streptomyces siamensis]|uniref:MFS transporter n=1 Tax=Streptomyces siamensis TaxID=1274986 RepID=A0ABP9J5N6_9ACTN